MKNHYITESTFCHDRLEVTMGHHQARHESVMDNGIDTCVEIYWDGKLIGYRPTLPDAIQYTYNAVCVCRYDLTAVLSEDGERDWILDALANVGDYLGLNLSDRNNLTKVPAIETRIQVSDTTRTKFAHHDDIPQLYVKQRLSNFTYGARCNDAIETQIRAVGFRNEFTTTISYPVSNLPDIQAIVDAFVEKHFL